MGVQDGETLSKAGWERAGVRKTFELSLQGWRR